MSINDAAEIRRLFAAFHIREIRTAYTVGQANKSKPVTELLVLNYRPSSAALKGLRSRPDIRPG